MRLVLLGVLAAAIAMLVGLDSLLVRASIFPDLCFYRLAGSVPAEVDVFLIGSSRLRRGVDPDQLAEILGVPSLRVINFGHGGSTLDADYAMTDDLLNKRRISLILAEANVEGVVDKTSVGFSSNPFTPYYLQLATFRQILKSPFTESSQPIVLRVYDMVNLLKAKIESEWRSVAAGQVKRVYKNALLRNMERPNICWHKQLFEDTGADAERTLQKREEELAEAKRAFFAEHASWLDEGFLVPRLFADKLKRGQISLMRQMVEMAKAHGARIAFVNFPSYLGWPPSPDFLKEFDERIGAPLLSPDKGWLEQIQEKGYHDTHHLAALGRRAYTAWLAQQLIANGLWDHGP